MERSQESRGRERERVSDHGKQSKGEMEFTSLCVQ